MAVEVSPPHHYSIRTTMRLKMFYFAITAPCIHSALGKVIERGQVGFGGLDGVHDLWFGLIFESGVCVPREAL